ncbi:MAG: DUF481 domain-containing protein [Gemmatimonadota bacterium]
MDRPHRSPVPLFASALAALLLPAGLSAQNPAPGNRPPDPGSDVPVPVPTVDWTSEAELGASLFFGNTAQALILTRTGTAAETAHFTFATDASFQYGEASEPSGERDVSRRSWAAETTLDYRGHDVISSFLHSQLEGSYEKRIDLRVRAGVGARIQMADSERTKAGVRLAVLAERTDPRLEEQIDPVRTVARGSIELNLQRRVGDEDRVRLSNNTSYGPRVGRFEDYTMKSVTSAAFRVSETLHLKLSFVDSFDSGARNRGARSNNDGELVLSLTTTFR